ncbi:MAG: hypothetical protein HGA67_00305 [Candidatus Yonathbacteria bacterium]|nr:hypothetical protein [Candidatus Yonathbacteria bacterium]
MKQWLGNHWLKLIAVFMLAGALYVATVFGTEYNSLPYAYYQLMNWVVMGAALMTAEQASTKNRMFLVWLFIFVAVIFNPIAPFELRPDAWQIADVAAILFFLLALSIRKEKNA